MSRRRNIEQKPSEWNQRRKRRIRRKKIFNFGYLECYRTMIQFKTPLTIFETSTTSQALFPYYLWIFPTHFIYSSACFSTFQLCVESLAMTCIFQRKFMLWHGKPSTRPRKWQQLEAIDLQNVKNASSYFNLSPLKLLSRCRHCAPNSELLPVNGIRGMREDGECTSIINTESRRAVDEWRNGVQYT